MKVTLQATLQLTEQVFPADPRNNTLIKRLIALMPVKSSPLSNRDTFYMCSSSLPTSMTANKCPPSTVGKVNMRCVYRIYHGIEGKVIDRYCSTD